MSGETGTMTGGVGEQEESFNGAFEFLMFCRKETFQWSAERKGGILCNIQNKYIK